MRQTGVQVQDIGTQLCWQVYIDDPGAALGVGQLVHLASKVYFVAVRRPADEADAGKTTRRR